MMIYAYEAWHFYYWLVDGDSFFYESIAWCLYAYIIFWASVMPFFCAIVLLKICSERRRER